MVKRCLAIDAMGSDKGPAEIIEGVSLALDGCLEGDLFYLAGDENILNPILEQKALLNDPRIKVIHASEVVHMDEKPLQAIKKKKDSSMVRGMELVKDGEAGALISCGNTGALMAGGTIKIRPLPGVDRPAIGSIIPSNNCNFVLIDAGANPEPKPIHLVHNAIMGSIYAKIVLNIPNPRVGLLTIGTEEGKGTELVQQSHQMLKQLGNVINYTGPVEGFQLFANQVDVVVCDGFVGNILLKTAESLFEMIKTVLKEELNATPIRKIGALMSKGAFTGMKKRLNPVEFAGAPFLGLKGNVLKAHGSSDRHYIKGAIGMARRVVQFEMLSEIEKSIETANKVINE